jgi:hypothetical protein
MELRPTVKSVRIANKTIVCNYRPTEKIGDINATNKKPTSTVQRL